MSEEMEDFVRSVSDGNPVTEAANRRVMAAFNAVGRAPAGMKASVLAAATSQRRSRTAVILAPVLAFSVLAVFLLLRQKPAVAPQYSPDWLCYENFPYYSEDARQYLNPPDPEGVTLDTLIPSSEKGV
jgi:hypothetical protein